MNNIVPIVSERTFNLKISGGVWTNTPYKQFIIQCRTYGNSWEDSSEWDDAVSAMSALDEIRGENKRLGVSEFTSQFRVVQRVEIPTKQLEEQ